MRIWKPTQSYENKGNSEAAEALIFRLPSFQLEPNYAILNALLHVYSNSSSCKKMAEAVFEQMRDTCGHRIKAVDYNLVAKAGRMSDGAPHVESWIQRLQGDGLTLDRQGYLLAFNANFHARSYDRAWYWLGRIIRTGWVLSPTQRGKFVDKLVTRLYAEKRWAKIVAIRESLQSYDTHTLETSSANIFMEVTYILRGEDEMAKTFIEYFSMAKRTNNRRYRLASVNKNTVLLLKKYLGEARTLKLLESSNNLEVIETFQ